MGKPGTCPRSEPFSRAVWEERVLCTLGPSCFGEEGFRQSAAGKRLWVPRSLRFLSHYSSSRRKRMRAKATLGFPGPPVNWLQ